MLYNGVGQWLPTRLAPEASHRFALPGGSVASSAVLVTERADNARLEGLGCAGDRRCSPCEAKAAARENRARRLGAFRESGACPDAGFLKCSAIEWANYAMNEAYDISQAALAIGGPGAFGGYTPGYYASFAPLQDRASTLVNEYVNLYSKDLPEPVKSTVHDVVRDTSAGIKAVFDRSYDGNLFGLISDTVLRTPAFLYETAAQTGGTLSDAGDYAGGFVPDLSWGKYILPLAAGALLLGLYGRARG